MVTNLFRYLIMVGCLAGVVSANAATWEIVSFTNDFGTGHAYSQVGLFGFADGQYTQTQTVNYNGTNYSDYKWSVVSSSDPSQNSGGYYFGNYGHSAPTVDTINHTIDLSSLTTLYLNPIANTGSGYNNGWIYDNYMGYQLLTGTYVSGCAIGGPCYGFYDYDAPSQYVDNADGSHTVNWTAGGSCYVYDGNCSAFNLSMTFREAVVSTVPVPTAAWLLGSGLLGLIGADRRKAA